MCAECGLWECKSCFQYSSGWILKHVLVHFTAACSSPWLCLLLLNLFISVSQTRQFPLSYPQVHWLFSLPAHIFPRISLANASLPLLHFSAPEFIFGFCLELIDIFILSLHHFRDIQHRDSLQQSENKNRSTNEKTKNSKSPGMGRI